MIDTRFSCTCCHWFIDSRATSQEFYCITKGKVLDTTESCKDFRQRLIIGGFVPPIGSLFYMVSQDGSRTKWRMLAVNKALRKSKVSPRNCTLEVLDEKILRDIKSCNDRNSSYSPINLETIGKFEEQLFMYRKIEIIND